MQPTSVREEGGGAKGVNAGGSIIYIYTARTRTPADPFWLTKKKGKKIKLTSTHEKKRVLGHADAQGSKRAIPCRSDRLDGAADLSWPPRAIYIHMQNLYLYIKKEEEELGETIDFHFYFRGKEEENRIPGGLVG